MQIGELSTRTGATVRMLRYYEEHGLLEPRRTESGYRIYAESDVLRVRYIRCMLASALPTSVVAQALRFLLDERPSIPELPEERIQLAEVLQAELDALTERIAILDRSREQLARFVDDVRSELVGPLQPRPDVVPDVGPAVRHGGPLPVGRAEALAMRGSNSIGEVPTEPSIDRLIAEGRLMSAARSGHSH